jgi:hypothetical protein
MPPAGIEPAIPVSGRLQNHALDRAATRIGRALFYHVIRTLSRVQSAVLALRRPRNSIHGVATLEKLNTLPTGNVSGCIPQNNLVSTK